jgi:hypothetical protein
VAIDFSTKLFDLYGKEIQSVIMNKDGPPVIGPATLGSVVVDALSNASIALTTVEKLNAFKLAQNIAGTKQTPLAAESIALIKKCIAAVQSPIVLGRCFEILDPASIPDQADGQISSEE